MEYFRNAGTDTAMAEATKLTIISTKKEFDQVLASDKPVVIDYMASWCGKCSMIAPYLEELAVSPESCLRHIGPGACRKYRCCLQWLVRDSMHCGASAAACCNRATCNAWL